MAAHVGFAAGTFILAKPAATGFQDPAALTLARALLAGVMLLALTGWAIPRPRFRPREWLEIVFLGVLLVPANQYPFVAGLRQTAPGHPALLYALTPMGVLLLSAALARRRPPLRHALGVMVAFGGVLVLLRPWDQSRLAHELRSGDLWIGAAVLAWAVYTVAARALCRKHHPFTVTTWSLVAGALCMLPFSGRSLLEQPWTELSSSAWVGLWWMAGITSVAMMLLWNHLLQRAEPVEVAICANAQPPITALLSLAAAWAGLAVGEIDLGPVFWSGMACVLTGVALVQWRPRSGRPSRRLPLPPSSPTRRQAS